jgi:AcrR family transcriptional regulator
MSDANRRERILAAAERLFQHYGQRKTTMADIARDVGIGVGSLYLDFPSKEALLGELSGKRARAVSVAMDKARSVDGSAERIAAMLVARVEALLRVADEGVHACELVACGTSKAGFGADVRGALGAELERGRSAGEIDCGPIDEVLDAMELAFTALSPPYLFRFEPARARSLARSLSILVVHGVAKRPAGR